MRKRAKSFENHYSQARMFWKSMSAVEAESTQPVGDG
jgi:catalase